MPSLPQYSVARSRYERPRGQASSSIGTEHGVDRLARVGMPSHRAYLFPQSRTPQSTVIHHQHGHVPSVCFGQQLEQAHRRGYPFARFVGGENVPCNGNSATAIDHAYDDGGVWSPLVVGSIANTSLSDCHHESSHLNSGTKHNFTSNCTRHGLARSVPSYSHSLRYCRRLFQCRRCRRGTAQRRSDSCFWRVLSHRPTGSGPLSENVRDVACNVELSASSGSIQVGGAWRNWQPFCLVPKRCHKVMRFPSSYTILKLYLPLSARRGRGLG